MSSEIDVTSAQIVNAPDVRQWRETAKITRVSFDGATTRIAFDKQDGPNRWLDVRPAGWDGDLQIHDVVVPADPRQMGWVGLHPDVAWTRR